MKTLYTYGPFDTLHVILSFVASGGLDKRAAPTTGGNGVTVDRRVSLDVRRSWRRPPVGAHARRFAPHGRGRASRSRRSRGRRPRPGTAEVVDVHRVAVGGRARGACPARPVPPGRTRRRLGP